MSLRTLVSMQNVPNEYASAPEHIVPSKNSQKARNGVKPTIGDAQLQTSRIPAAMHSS